MNLLASTTSDSSGIFIHPILLPNRVWIPVPDKLGAAGFGAERDFNLGEYVLSFHACSYFIERLNRSAYFNTRTNSYGWKHEVEAWLRDQTGQRVHIPNGIFIAAANYCGIRWRRIGSTPNVSFNLKMPHGSLLPLSEIELLLLEQARRLGR